MAHCFTYQNLQTADNHVGIFFKAGRPYFDTNYATYYEWFMTPTAYIVNHEKESKAPREISFVRFEENMLLTFKMKG